MSDTVPSPTKPEPLTQEQRYERELADAEQRHRQRMERCDRCSQPSQTEWLNAALGMNLRLCGHHTKLHAPALPDKGFEDITQKETEDQ